MINNRLFKKINSIFWGILTWLPLVFTILCFFKTSGIQVDNQQNFQWYLDQFFLAFYDVSNEVNAWIINPLTDYFLEFMNYFGGVSGVLVTVVEVISWVCFVQVLRLFAYVFYWFIDLISGLFDLMTFNRKGDN